MAELKFVEIRLDRLAELLKAENLMSEHECAGVDNWPGRDHLDFEAIREYEDRVDEAVENGTLTPNFV